MGPVILQDDGGLGGEEADYFQLRRAEWGWPRPREVPTGCRTAARRRPTARPTIGVSKPVLRRLAPVTELRSRRSPERPTWMEEAGNGPRQPFGDDRGRCR